MLNRETIASELVIDHPECARVLQKHRIDFCCHGDRPLAELCEEQSLDTSAVLAELEGAISQDHVDVEFRSLSTQALIEYIVSRHHGYLREALPFVSSMSKKVARVHGGHNPRLLELEGLVEELCEALTPHLDEEEAKLFPSLIAAKDASPELAAELAGMFEEHEAVGELLQKIRAEAEDFSVPEWGCRSYNALFAELERLETDTLRHVHAENHVLRPRYS